jgi:hypothetical protein
MPGFRVFPAGDGIQPSGKFYSAGASDPFFCNAVASESDDGEAVFGEALLMDLSFFLTSSRRARRQV